MLARKEEQEQPSATPVIDGLKASNNWNPLWDLFAEMDPSWTEKFMDMATLP